MLQKKDCMEYILKSFPEVKKYWEKHVEFWDGEEAGLWNDIGVFVSYVYDLLIDGKTKNLKEIFVLVEFLLQNGDNDVQNAITTVFLESLVNRCENSNISTELFAKYLGKKSIEYCKAWDKFSGTKTKGLY